MKATTTVLIVFVAALFVLETVSHGYAGQQNQSGNNPNFNNDVSGSENGQTSPTNEAGAQRETPRVGNLQQPVIVRNVGWGWLLITGLAGYLLGRITSSRTRAQARDEDIRRNRAA